MGECMYRPTLSWPRVLVGGEWSASRPGRFTPEKEPSVPIVQEVGWTPETLWTTWRRKNSWPHRDSNSDPLGVEPVGSRYTDWAIPAHKFNSYLVENITSSLPSEIFVSEGNYAKPTKKTLGQKTHEFLNLERQSVCWFPTGARSFSSPQRPDQLRSPPSLLSSGYQGREVDHSPESIAEVKNGGATPPFLHSPSWYDA
jgi:hypothetical protein